VRAQSREPCSLFAYAGGVSIDKQIETDVQAITNAIERITNNENAATAPAFVADATSGPVPFLAANDNCHNKE